MEETAEKIRELQKGQQKGESEASCADRNVILPVDIRTFVISPDYLGKSNFWAPALEDLAALRGQGILGGVIEIGIGGGKSFLSTLLPLYDIYTLEHMQGTQGIDLYQRFQLDTDSPIYCAVLAANGTIAREVYRYMRAFAEECRWFQHHLQFDPRITSELQFRRPGEDRVRYIAYPGHSKVTSVISRNIYSYVLDEANYFTVASSSSSSKKDYAEELDQQLGARVDSRFGSAGSRVTISSRRTVNDFTHRKKTRLMLQPDVAAKYYLPPPRTSWHNWPDERRNEGLWRLFDAARFDWDGTECVPWSVAKDRDGLWIPRRFWDEFSANPEEALRNLASIPGDANEPFIRRKDKIRPDFEMQHPLVSGVKPQDWMRPSARFDDYVQDWLWGESSEVYHFHVDLALRGDACGVAVSRNCGTDAVALSRGERRPERVALVDLELLLQIKAPSGGEIEFAQVRRILYWLRDERGFRFRRSSFDGWQSKDSQQALARRGFMIEELSCDRNLEPHTNLKDALYEGRLFFAPAHGQTPQTTWDEIRIMAAKGDPHAVFQLELAQLERIGDKKVDHPPHGTKDVADAAAGAITQAIRLHRMSGSDS